MALAMIMKVEGAHSLGYFTAGAALSKRTVTTVALSLFSRAWAISWEFSPVLITRAYFIHTKKRAEK